MLLEVEHFVFPAPWHNNVSYFISGRFGQSELPPFDLIYISVEIVLKRSFLTRSKNVKKHLSYYIHVKTGML